MTDEMTYYGLGELPYPKNQVLEILRANLDQHKRIFAEACEGYKKQAEEILAKHLDEVRRGKIVRVAVNLPYPENHSVDYERVIRMLELTRVDTVVLDERQVQSYVQDDWAWKRQFLTSNAPYSQTAQVFLAE